jgi:hypothetical protein
MAITQVGSGTSDTDPGSSNSVTVTKPTGVASGDVLIAVWSSNENTVTPPSGFTLFDTMDDTTNLYRTYHYYKVCGGSEPSNYTFTKDVAADGAPIIVTMTAWRGVDNTTPIGNQSSFTDNGLGSGVTANPTTSFTQSHDGRLMFTRSSRSTTALITYTESGATWTEAVEATDFSGGSVRYANVQVRHDSDTTAGGSRSEPGTAAATTTTDNHYLLFCLKSDIPPVEANAGAVAATVTAYNPASFTVTTTSGFAAATVAAHNATVLTGVAAENVGHAAATVTAYDAKGWVIHPVDAGAIAFNASVAITTIAEHAAASVAAQGAVGYFGAPPSRSWRIPAETRSWRITADDRTWRIAAESRVYRIPADED